MNDSIDLNPDAIGTMLLAQSTNNNLRINCFATSCAKCHATHLTRRMEKDGFAIEFHFCKCGKNVIFEHTGHVRQWRRVTNLLYTQRQFNHHALAWKIPTMTAYHLCRAIRIVGRKQLKLTLST